MPSYTVVIGSIPATFTVSGISIPTDLVSFQAQKKQGNSLTYYMSIGQGGVQGIRKPWRALSNDGGILRLSGLVTVDKRDALFGLVNTGPFTIDTTVLGFVLCETREFVMRKNTNQTVFFNASFTYEWVMKHS
jgi:hypothetical protein